MPNSVISRQTMVKRRASMSVISFDVARDNAPAALNRLLRGPFMSGSSLLTGLKRVRRLRFDAALAYLP